MYKWKSSYHPPDNFCNTYRQNATIYGVCSIRQYLEIDFASTSSLLTFLTLPMLTGFDNSSTIDFSISKNSLQQSTNRQQLWWQLGPLRMCVFFFYALLLFTFVMPMETGPCNLAYTVDVPRTKTYSITLEQPRGTEWKKSLSFRI